MDREKRVQRIVEVVAVGASLALAAFLAFGPVPSMAEWSAALFFTLFGIVAAVLWYPTAKGTGGTISFLPFLGISLLSPSVAALLAVFVSTLVGELVLRRPLLKVVFNTSQHTFAVACGIAFFLMVGGESALVSSPNVLAFVGLVVAYFSVNKLAVSTVVATSSGTSTADHWLRSMKGSAVYDALSIPLVLFFAVAYSELGAGWTTVLALPMLGVRQLYRTVFALEKVNEELLQLMVASIEARDPYTSGHSQRVSRYARAIARSSGVSGRALERIEVAALLHDVGKIHEEFAAILRKPGALTDDEFAIMKSHPIRSAELVAKVSHFSDLVSPIRAHHEAWNGAGYPDRLEGESIPFAARVIALADTVDAMTTSRPYREGLTLDEVRAEIQRESGRQFDPDICAKLLAPNAWTFLVGVVAQAQREFPVSSDIRYGREVGNTGEFVALVGAPLSAS